MHRCEQCASCYLDPRPNRATIHLAYGRYFTHAQVDDSPADTKIAAARRLRRSWANGYRNWRYGTTLQPASSLGVAAAFILPWRRRILDADMRHIPRHRTAGRLLDVGAGNGAYLRRASSAGWNVVGVEPDGAAVEAACRSGLNVRQGGIECLSDAPESFDVITMNHVIEHVHDPLTVLTHAFALLKSDGVLHIETPNIDSYGHRRFGRHWRGLEPPRHLVLFSWDSLEMLLLKVGFKHLKRLPRIDVYPAMAAKSRAIKDGEDPERTCQPLFVDRAVGMLHAPTLSFRYRDSEFATILAFKQ